MPIATYGSATPPIPTFGIPQTGSFVAEPQFGGYTKGGASYGAAPPYMSYQPYDEYSRYGSATPPFPYAQSYTSASCMPGHQQHLMAPSAASFTCEQPIQQMYQMPTAASFMYEQPAQPYSNQQQYAATQFSHAIPQQPSFTAYPPPSNYACRGDMPQFQFFPSGAPGAEGPAKATGPMNHMDMSLRDGPRSPMNHHRDIMSRDGPRNHYDHSRRDSLVEPAQPKPTGLENPEPAGHGRAKPSINNNNGRAKSPMNKPNGSTWNKPPAKRTAKKKQGPCACSCGV